VLLQLILLYVLGIAFLIKSYNSFQEQRLMMWVMLLNYSILTGALLSARYWLASPYAKSVNLWIISILAVTAIFQCLMQFGIVQQWQSHGIDAAIIYYILPAIWLLSFVWIHLRQFSQSMLWFIPAAGALLIALGYFEIFIILIFMAWAMLNQQRLMQALLILL